MIRVLGIDPGSRRTGFGVIDVESQRNRFVDAGVIEIGHLSLSQRLKQIYAAVSELVTTHQPDHVAIERVFVNRNVDSALKLGQARGVAICAAAQTLDEVFEYSAREVKQAIVGTGGADKSQVQHMTRVLLCLQQKQPEDAADALAIALCHGHTWMNNQRLQKSARETLS